MVDVKVEGVEAVVKMLREYRGKKANAAIRKGTRLGCQLIASRARELIPYAIRRDRYGQYSIGNLRRAVKVAPIKRTRKGWVGSQVIVDGDGLGYTGDEFYAAFVEFGHRVGKRSAAVQRAQKRGNKAELELIDARPKVEGKHYFKTAANDMESAAVDIARQIIVAELSK
jgi:hypothetical protein